MSDQQANHFVRARDMLDAFESKTPPLAPLPAEASATVALTHAVLALATEVNGIRQRLERDAADRQNASLRGSPGNLGA